MYEKIVKYIKELYNNSDEIPLHAPVFIGNESIYTDNCIRSTYVSSIGEYVNSFQKDIASYTNSQYAIGVVNGTSALHVALQLSGVEQSDEVITQSLTFVATANAIQYCGATPIFIDVDLDTLGMSPEKLKTWLSENTVYNNQTNKTINKSTGNTISAILPMHTFGHPCRIDEIVEIGNSYNILVIEDAAEALGSFYKNKHVGTFGKVGIFSFNGNKIITTGGGGMLVTDDEEFAKKALHITTTAKIPHQWEFIHDSVAYNYRLPNINAALGVAQMEYIDKIISNKRETYQLYNSFFRDSNIKLFSEPTNSTSNYWLNTILFDDPKSKNGFLEYSYSEGVFTRPVWKPLNKLQMFKDCQKGDLFNSDWLETRIVNIPSSFREK